MTKIVTHKKPKKTGRMVVVEPKPFGFDHGMKTEVKRKKVTKI
jgi:hypothetical protein